MTDSSISDAAKAVVRRNTEEVQGRGNFELCEELFSAHIRSDESFGASPKKNRPWS